tara:strand:- start:247 stop:654 length:408 start_codon:yes stop_codon:yes gene_type:complete
MTGEFYSAKTNELFNMLIGFDPYFREKREFNKYPPYNIYEDGNKYRLELAVAGFSKKDIEITQQNSTLKIAAQKKNELKHLKPVVRGLGARSFSRVFQLAPYVEVTDIKLKDGILTIWLEKVLPEELKPKVLQIA